MSSRQIWAVLAALSAAFCGGLFVWALTNHRYGWAIVDGLLVAFWLANASYTNRGEAVKRGSDLTR